ncbi:AMP-binding protein [Salinibacterium sp. SYSU T00001]|uniref:AMP-binding protein n=1 Tax=Homoserinimonas sedimenticola TaxID=2986805 RepID=UPI002236AC56|nr:AMP-binding protein [Salinibacterium sedimenticola]MCW4385704.1 AMP-binding protein [Salinibacterium sedimenticola]
MRRLTPLDGGDWRAVAQAVRERFDVDGPALFLGSSTPPREVTDTTAAVIETSGSTGYPKRVVLSEAALRASADATAHALGGDGQWLLALPASYVAGLQVLVRSHVAGLPVVQVDPGFDVEAFAAASARLDAPRRYTALVPAQLARLVEAPEAAARFDAILVGGQALPAALAARARDVGLRVVRTYGSTETATGCLYDGYPVGGTRTRLVDGVLELAGPTLADGYLGDPELTARAFVEEGGVRWYRTGDRARIHDDGRVEVLGRADNVIVSGGINVSLDRVEAVVREMPGLEQAVVVAASSERWGEVPVVVVARATDAAGSRIADDLLPSIRRLLLERIGPAAQPDRIVVLPELPLLTSGKPDRRALAALAAR